MQIYILCNVYNKLNKWSDLKLSHSISISVFHFSWLDNVNNNCVTAVNFIYFRWKWIVLEWWIIFSFNSITLHILKFLEISYFSIMDYGRSQSKCYLSLYRTLDIFFSKSIEISSSAELRNFFFCFCIISMIFAQPVSITELPN